MEDTQRSQTTSEQNRKSVEQTTHNNQHRLADEDKPPVLVGEASLQKIAGMARENPEMVFTAVAHRINLPLLHEAHRRIKKGKSIGVDEVSASEYAVELDKNLYNLHQRLSRGQYVATPVKRIWIEKDNGKMRPSGIPAFEDKIVQKAVEMILSAIYEPNFYDFSHGFRAGHSQHMAIKQLRESCIECNSNWIVSADITGLFDNIDHGHLREFIKQRVNDGGIIRLLGKWLKAGVMEEEKYYHSESGTPQGGVISPVLSNIFLHNVLDDWFVKEVQPRMKGRSFIIRFADDFIAGFELEADAVKTMTAMRKRFNRFGLELHPDKTKLIRFGRPTAKSCKGNKPGTFDFLGFTFYWGKARQNYWVIKKKTVQKRLSRFNKRVWEWCKVNRHKPIQEQHDSLCSKLRGYYQYFGVICNYKALSKAHYYVTKAWRFWLSRRCHKGKVKFQELAAKYPLPKPRIIHSF
jgi:group II intron reverse transcriptase/maturase